MLSAGAKPSQQCVTTTLALTLGEEQDPAVRAACDVIFQWIGLLFDERMDSRRAEAAWKIAVQKLSASGAMRWGYVTGPMCACIAVLLDLQWVPTMPGKWLSPDGMVWFMDSDLVATKTCCAQVLNAICGSVLQQLWAKAIRHRGGTGIQGPIELGFLRSFVAQLYRKGDAGAAAMLIKEAAGGLWPRERKHAAGLVADPLCDLSDAGVVQDVLHIMWGLQVHPRDARHLRVG